jgi:hypothetical protein
MYAELEVDFAKKALKLWNRKSSVQQATTRFLLHRRKNCFSSFSEWNNDLSGTNLDGYSSFDVS